MGKHACRVARQHIHIECLLIYDRFEELSSLSNNAELDKHIKPADLVLLYIPAHLAQ